MQRITKRLFLLAVKSRSVWLVSIILLIIIVALLITGITLAPTPVFIYPIL